jgi:hypothetical protein
VQELFGGSGVMPANQQRVDRITPAVHPKGDPAKLPGGLFDCPPMLKPKWKKLVAADGSEIIGCTILAWACFFALYVLLALFR